MKIHVGVMIACILAGTVLDAQALAKPPASAANKVVLYQQPDKKAAVVATIMPGAPIMPIFTQGQWTKVADPSNGHVGWISNDVLKQSQLPQLKTWVATPNSHDGNSSYNIVQYSGSVGWDDKQMAQMMQAWQAQQAALQAMLGQMVAQSAASLNAVAQQLQTQPIQIPMVVPVVVTSTSAPNTAATENKK